MRRPSAWLAAFRACSAVHATFDHEPKELLRLGSELVGLYALPDSYFTPTNTLIFTMLVDRLASPPSDTVEVEFRKDLALYLLGRDSPSLAAIWHQVEVDSGNLLHGNPAGEERLIAQLRDPVLSAALQTHVDALVTATAASFAPTGVQPPVEAVVLRIDPGAPEGTDLHADTMLAARMMGPAVLMASAFVIKNEVGFQLVFPLRVGQALVAGTAGASDRATLQHEVLHCVGEPDFGGAGTGIREARASSFANGLSYLDAQLSLVGMGPLGVNILGDVRSGQGYESVILQRWLQAVGPRTTLELLALQPSDHARFNPLASRLNDGLRHGDLSAGDAIQFRAMRRMIDTGRAPELQANLIRYADVVLDSVRGDLSSLSEPWAALSPRVNAHRPAGDRQFDTSFVDAVVTNVLVHRGAGKADFARRDLGPEVADLQREVRLEKPTRPNVHAAPLPGHGGDPVPHAVNIAAPSQALVSDSRPRR